MSGCRSCKFYKPDEPDRPLRTAPPLCAAGGYCQAARLDRAGPSDFALWMAEAPAKCDRPFWAIARNRVKAHDGKSCPLYRAVPDVSGLDVPNGKVLAAIREAEYLERGFDGACRPYPADKYLFTAPSGDFGE